MRKLALAWPCLARACLASLGPGSWPWPMALAHGSGQGQGLFWGNVLKAKAFEVVVGLLIANEISYELLSKGIIFTLL